MKMTGGDLCPNAQRVEKLFGDTKSSFIKRNHIAITITATGK